MGKFLPSFILMLFWIYLAAVAVHNIKGCGRKNKAEEICAPYTVETVYKVRDKLYAVCGNEEHRPLKE